VVEYKIFEVPKPNEERVDVRIHDTTSREVEEFDGWRWRCGMLV
jgi:hypothetical protein